VNTRKFLRRETGIKFRSVWKKFIWNLHVTWYDYHVTYNSGLCNCLCINRFSLNFLCRYWYALCVQLNLNLFCSPWLLLSWVFYCQHIYILGICFFLILIMTNEYKGMCMCLYVSLLIFILVTKQICAFYLFEWLVWFSPRWHIRCIMAPHLVPLILWLAIVTVSIYDIYFSHLGKTRRVFKNYFRELSVRIIWKFVSVKGKHLKLDWTCLGLSLMMGFGAVSRNCSCKLDIYDYFLFPSRIFIFRLNNWQKMYADINYVKP
jgi:hypothetical protein